ncbi:hypothetical protein [Nocardia salmonicida]|uniref:hypothetical protein n=1 Tax=Nocardia salmonicida TaxID=53431 RepID=UPI00364290AC
MIFEILAAIGALVLALQAAAQIPAAVTTLLRACRPMVDAAHELRSAITRPGSRLRDHDTDGL